ncbi:cytochrome P450 [Pholiota conissans]|uniref:Cytochrome P450 n=1 Tax=Pholiota conissans TaxID=109636 RepID=A0A9P6CW68_9AGAR|nr:cytochrome P450 [Pholiota conissans]
MDSFSSSNFLLLVQSLSICFTSWALSKIIRRFVLKSPLDNVPGPIPKSWRNGIFPQLFNVNAWDFHKEIAQIYGSVIKIKSFFGENQLYIFDPMALHHIMVKDREIFEQSEGSLAAAKVIFGPSLLATYGDVHRKQRKMLNPVFSIKNLREMTPTFYNVINKLHDAFAVKVKSGPQEIDVLSWMSRAALELVGQSGLGYSFDSLEEDSVPHPYSISTKKLMPTAFKLFFIRTYLISHLVKIGIPRWIVDLFPSKPVHDLANIVDVLHNTSIEIFESKKKALAEGDEAVSRQIGQGKDILSILMRANMEASNEDILSEEELLATMSSLTFAAMDTTSSALSRILHMLSMNQDVQETLRQEIRTAKKEYGPELDYDTLCSLPYLDAVCRETLRLFAPVPFITKTARKDAMLPLSKPIKGIDGKELRELFVSGNTNIIVGIMAANRNPEIWGSDAYEWKPSRWLEALPENVSAARIPGVYSHLMTFGGGGRACLGFKFSQLEMSQS